MADIVAGRESRCENTACGGLCKPSITFFGEKLGPSFSKHRAIDFSRLDKKCCIDDCNAPTVTLADNTRHLYCASHSSFPGEVAASARDADADADANTEDRIACACDLLLVMGTSLKVNPVAGLADEVHWLCPRVLFNNELVHVFGAEKDEEDWTAAFRGADNGFRFGEQDNYRDVAVLQPCDVGVGSFVKLLGWDTEFEELIENYRVANALSVTNSPGQLTGDRSLVKLTGTTKFAVFDVRSL